MTATPRKRRAKVESYAEWMARIDAQVESAVKNVEREPPSYSELNPAQKRIVEMLITHLRKLPTLSKGEDAYDKKEYEHINIIIGRLFLTRWPEWEKAKRTDGGRRNVQTLPGDQPKLYDWMLRNCGGIAPAETTKDCDYDD